MQDFIDAMTFAFKEILRPKSTKYAMGTGLVVTLIWILIAYLLWSPLVTLTGFTIELLPFSMIRSNGAWMLSSFIWLQLVLVTFALIFAFLGNFITQQANKSRYNAIAIIIAIFSALFWSIIWFYEGDFIYDQILKLFTWLPFETIQKSLAYLIAFYIIYSAIIVTHIFVTSLFSINYLNEIRQEHFAYDAFNQTKEINTLLKTIKDTLIFVALSIITLPLLFIPIVNFIILVLLWVWLMKDTLSYDTASYVFAKDFKGALQKYKKAVWAIAFIGSLFNFIPVFNLFGPYFSELAMLYYFKEKRDLTDETI
jgi:hypothetical protein